LIELKGIVLDTSIEQIITDIKQELNLKGINKLRDIKRTNNNIMVSCPIHNGGREKNASCGVSTVRQGSYPAGTINCFSCGYKADIETFISDIFNKEDGGIYGWKWLIKNYVFQDKEDRKISFNIPSREKKIKGKDIIPEHELDKYRYIHPYMYERGLTDKIINYFDIGYDRDNYAITVPLKDIKGDVIALQKRRIDNKQFINMKGVKKNFLYGLYEAYKNMDKVDELWITESVFDCLTCWKHGNPAVATLGTPAYFQIKLLKECPVRKLVLAFDNDDSGKEFKHKINDKINNKMIYEVIFPEGKKDINECDECMDRLDKQLYIG
jgi:DNA primase